MLRSPIPNDVRILGAYAHVPGIFFKPLGLEFDPQLAIWVWLPVLSAQPPYRGADPQVWLSALFLTTLNVLAETRDIIYVICFSLTQ